MMTRREVNTYAKLPETITIYRGCSGLHPDGFSWSLLKSVAKKFPFYLRHHVSGPALVTATVKKEDILAIKLGRGEREVVTNKATIVSIEPLLPPKKRTKAAAA